MPALVDVAQYLVTGLQVGGVYALMSVGLALIFGVMRVVNFAQGDFLMLGMYSAYALFIGLAIDPLLGAILIIPAFLLVGIVVHRGLLQQVIRKGQTENAQLIFTLGLSLVLQNGALMLFGPTPRGIPVPYGASGWLVGPLMVNQARTYSFLAACLVLAGLYLVLYCTQLGRALRATSDNVEAATYMGINVQRSYMLAMGLGVAASATAGALITTYYPMQPYIAWDFIVLMFIAVVLGGLGRIEGAFFGGLIIGVVQNLSAALLPLQLQNLSLYVIFLLILLLRPHGLFGRQPRVY